MDLAIRGYGIIQMEPLKKNGSLDSAYWFGSVLSEPFCKAHEFYRRTFTVDALNPDAIGCANLAQKFFLMLAALSMGGLGVLTTPGGLLIRELATRFEDQPFLYAVGNHMLKAFPEDGKFSLLTWNICGLKGYAISDGGLTPISFRIDAIIQQIKGDVVCLYEVFDICTAHELIDGLSPQGYNYFYYNMGARSLGLSSGLFVASIYPIKNPRFELFSSTAGRASYSGKGVFSFTVFGVQFHTTHLNHSEMPNHPIEEEITCRRLQLNQIKSIVKTAPETLQIIITGDLNMDEGELKSHKISKHFSPGETQFNAKTWPGDAWCAEKIYDKKASDGCNLDHTLGKNIELTTVIAFDTLFDPKNFTSTALSDHRPLYTIFKIG